MAGGASLMFCERRGFRAVYTGEGNRMMAMKKKWFSWIVCAGMAAAVCGCGRGNHFHNPSRGDTLVVATNAYSEPYAYYEGDELIGIDVEIAKAIADKLGMELEIRNVEPDSILKEVNSGKANIGMAGMAATEERLQEADFSDPYIRITQAVIVRSDSGITKTGDFRGGIAGVLSGAAEELVSADLEDVTVRSYGSGEDAVQALLNDTIDAVIIGKETAEELVSGTEGVTMLEEKMVARGCCVAVAKGNEELLDDIDKALDAIIANGTVFEITNKYMAEN